MAAEFNFVDYDKYENWIAVVVGLSLTVEGLQDYCHGKLSSLNSNIKMVINQQKLSDCTKNCSKRYKNNVQSWCVTCSTWKSELEIHNRDRIHWRGIQWSKINSIDWKCDLEEIAKVFMNKIPDCKNILKDLGPILSVFRNCDEFHISDQVIMAVSTVRNKYYAHFYQLKLSRYEKERCIDSLIDLLSVPEVQIIQSAKWITQTLQRVKRAQYITKDIIDSKTKQHVIMLIDRRIQEIDGNSETQNAQNCPQENDLNILRKRMNYFDTSPKNNVCETIRRTMMSKLFLSVCIVILTIFMFPKENINYMEGLKHECLSMYFEEFGNSDWDFYFDAQYVFNNTIVERRWLKSVVETRLNTSENGLLVISEMGYGKSSMVASIVCAADDSVWYDFKKSLLVYHMCQYDVEMSKEPAIFIRNIAAMLSKRFPSIYQTIRSDNITDGFIFGTHCSKDPIGCFDRLVVKPIKQNPHILNSSNLLIVLDAADECEIAGGKIDIVSVISHRLQQLPLDVKLLVTSRDILSVKNKLSYLSVVSLHSFPGNLTDDLTTYVKLQLNIRTYSSQMRLNELVKISNGSFLFLKLYMESCVNIDDCSFDNIPSSVSKLYRANMARIFGVSGERFQLAKSFFEILCVSKYPLNLETLLEISGIEMEYATARLFVKNEMKHFLHYSNGLYSLIHKSLNDYFLMLQNDSSFYLDIRKGHVQIAEYLLKNISATSLIDIAFHVASAHNLHLEERFKQLFQSSEKLHAASVSHLTHHIAQTVNSYRTLQLLAAVIVDYNMDTRDNNNETAAFIAAAHGNYETLRWLLDNGAQIEFEKYKEQYLHISTPDLISECKYVYFCGYNMLEISAQNGHLETVKMLLSRNKNILYHKTSFGSTAFELAAANGHVAVVKYLINIDKTTPTLHSLYLAAENGYAEIVELILKYNVRDVCIPCNTSLFWLPDLTQRAQQAVVYSKHIFKDRTIFFLDDWRLIMCESALHAAIRNCHFEVALVLLNGSKNSTECINRSGMTPIHSAIKYNCLAIFKTLFDLEESSKPKGCVDVHSIFLSEFFLNKKEQIEHRNNTCPKGAKISHLLAIFNHWDFYKFLIHKGFREWDIPDDEGLTSLHYAACYSKGNVYLFYELIGGEYIHFKFLAKSLNGSTPYHSAAYCKSLPGHLYSYNPEWLGIKAAKSLNHGIPDVLDNDDRSIVHYLFLGIPDVTTSIVAIRMYFDNNINMTRVDKFGRNFLHYAVKFGQMDEIKYITDRMSNAQLVILLKQTDITGKTPLQEVFNRLPYLCNAKYSVSPLKCDINNIVMFNSSCHKVFSSASVPEELFILYFVNTFHKQITLINMTDLMYIAANHCSLYSLVTLNVYYRTEFNNVISNYTHVYNLLHLFKGSGDLCDLYSATILLCKVYFKLKISL